MKVGDEPIASSRDGLDVPPIRRSFVQRLAERRDRHRQVVLFDDRVRPHPREQLLLPEQVALVLHQHLQQVECLEGERHHLAVAQQPPLAGIEKEGTEGVQEFVRASE